MSIKIENVILTSPEQILFIIQGLRNPMNSYSKSDSLALYENEYYDINGHSSSVPESFKNERFYLGDNDHSLMQSLSNAGTEHRKYMRMMPVYVRITAPLYW